MLISALVYNRIFAFRFRCSLKLTNLFLSASLKNCLIHGWQELVNCDALNKLQIGTLLGDTLATSQITIDSYP